MPSAQGPGGIFLDPHFLLELWLGECSLIIQQVQQGNNSENPGEGSRSTQLRPERPGSRWDASPGALKRFLCNCKKYLHLAQSSFLCIILSFKNISLKICIKAHSKTKITTTWNSGQDTAHHFPRGKPLGFVCRTFQRCYVYANKYNLQLHYFFFYSIRNLLYVTFRSLYFRQ